jgi:hypothetical protein
MYSSHIQMKKASRRVRREAVRSNDDDPWRYTPPAGHTNPCGANPVITGRTRVKTPTTDVAAAFVFMETLFRIDRFRRVPTACLSNARAQ